VRFDPVLLDEVEIPAGGALSFSWARVPYSIRKGPVTRLRVQTNDGWRDCADRSFDPHGVKAVEAEVCFTRD